MRQERIIRKTVKALGLTLRDFAAQVPVTPGYLQDLMHGRALPSLERINGLVAASDGHITLEEVAKWRRA